MTDSDTVQVRREPPVLRIIKKKWHGPCIYKIREVKSPIHEEFRGFRILIAVPNMAAIVPYKGIPAPSFQPRYLIMQSSDLLPEEADAYLQKVLDWLKQRGFVSVEHADDYADRIRTKCGWSTES